MLWELQTITLRVAGSSPARRRTLAQSVRAGCFLTPCRNHRRFLSCRPQRSEGPAVCSSDIKPVFLFHLYQPRARHKFHRSSGSAWAGSNPVRCKAVAQSGRAGKNVPSLLSRLALFLSFYSYQPRARHHFHRSQNSAWAGSNPIRRKAIAQSGRAVDSTLSCRTSCCRFNGECRWNYMVPLTGWVQVPLQNRAKASLAERSTTLVAVLFHQCENPP